MLQRKRPALTGAASQQHQPIAKKAKLSQPRPATAIATDRYSQLANPTALSTPTAPRHNQSNRTLMLTQASGTSALFAASAPPAVLLTASAVSSTEGRLSRQHVGVLPASAGSRATNGSPALSQLHFLVSSAHLTALSAPATSRHLIRTMRHLAGAANVPIAAAVSERYCDACCTLLIPGVTCRARTRRDKQKEDRWHRSQLQRKQKKAAAKRLDDEERKAQEDERDSDQHSAERVQAHPLTRKQRSKGRQRAETVRRQKQSDVDATAAGVTFVFTVNVCSYCGHENVVAGTQRKRGGLQRDDARKAAGMHDKQPTKKRKQPATTSASALNEPLNERDRARLERQKKRKAQSQTEKLKKQQTLTGGKPLTAPKTGRPTATPAPDPFAGSLFLKFQKPVSQRTIRARRTTNHSAPLDSRLSDAWFGTV